MPTKSPLSLYAEMTPNPLAMKFVADTLLAPEGMQLEYLDAASAADSPVAQKLFELPFVKSIFISANYITVLKNDKAQWDDIVLDVRDYIKNFLQQGGKIILPDTSENEKQTNAHNVTTVIDHTAPSNEIEWKIISVLEDYVRPAVEGDGGMILFKSFHDGIVTLKLKGSCSGCPSSALTLKAAVEQMLKRMVPEVTEVRQEVSEE
jgi:NFU1 iron-sulfur cluster scaffold homolog, mitochondrial